MESVSHPRSAGASLRGASQSQKNLSVHGIHHKGGATGRISRVGKFSRAIISAAATVEPRVPLHLVVHRKRTALSNTAIRSSAEQAGNCVRRHVQPVATVLTAGAVAGAVNSVLALARDVLPDRPSHVEAVVQAVRVGSFVSLSDFDRLESAPTTASRDAWDIAASPRDLRRTALGRIVTVDITLRGLRGEALDVCWSLHPASPRRLVPVEFLLAHCVDLVSPEADDQRLTKNVWVPVVPPRGSWMLVMSIFKRDERLARHYGPQRERAAVRISTTPHLRFVPLKAWQRSTAALRKAERPTRARFRFAREQRSHRTP
jgi:hypothetical protein